MGLEAVCSVRYGSRVAEGKALLLETKSLIFRGGEFRLNIPYGEMKSVEAADGMPSGPLPRGCSRIRPGAQG